MFTKLYPYACGTGGPGPRSRLLLLAAQTRTISSANVTPSHADFRVGYIDSIERHPNAEKLYVSKIFAGGDDIRTVCSGLVDHFSAEELHNRKVVLVANLKPAKLRGIASEAMLLAASNSDGKVELVNPPEGSQVGDALHVESHEPYPGQGPKLSVKVWRALQSDLRTDHQCNVTYKGLPLLSSSGQKAKVDSFTDAVVS